MSKILELKNVLEKEGKSFSRTQLEKKLRNEAYENGKSYVDIIYMYLRNQAARIML